MLTPLHVAVSDYVLVTRSGVRIVTVRFSSHVTNRYYEYVKMANTPTVDNEWRFKFH